MVESARRPGTPAMMAALVAVSCLIQVIFGERAPWQGGMPGFGVTPPVESVLLLSVVCLLLQMLLMCYPFLTMIRYTAIPGLFRTRLILLPFPFLVAAAMKTPDGPGRGRRSEAHFVFLGFLSSKVWLRYAAEVRADPASEGNPLQEFPRQYTCMSLGPWISNTFYLITGLALILALMAFAILRLAEDRPGGVSSSSSDDVGPMPEGRRAGG